MIKVLEKAFAKVQELSPERQAIAAELLEEFAATQDGVYQLTDEERQLVQVGLDELDRGEFVTEEEMRQVFDRYRK